MSFKLKAQLKISQQLSMTTQLQQSIKLLSLNHQEMKETIENELLENPVLQIAETEQAEEQETFLKDKKSEEDSSLGDMEHKKSLQEWAEASKGSSSNYKSSSSWGQSENPLENRVAEPVTLKSHLLWQVQVSRFSENEKSMMALLIFHLDDRGYLGASLKELAEKENLSIDQLEQSLNSLQNMDPIGVGARDIKECLLIQARHLEEDTNDMVSIIQNHLENLQNKKYSLIANQLNLSEEEVLDCCQIIQSMEPIPARNFSSQPTEYITPDIYIYKEGKEFKISLNEDGFPQLKIDNQYKKVLHVSSPYKSDMKKYIKEKIQAGDWLIRSLLQRQETIQKVVTSLIKHQREFLEGGFLYLKPLILQDIAEDISVHISTVSRVITNKYAYTPQGLIPLKYFFNPGVRNSRGESISLPVVKYHIKQWIAEESSQKPLSDMALVEKLKSEFYLSLSRRTVAQYRDSIDIPPANKRKTA